MITHSQAKSMARSLWGSQDIPKSVKMNRKGVFNFPNGHFGGMIIDAETLSFDEEQAFRHYRKPDFATRYIDPFKDTEKAFRSPYAQRINKNYPAACRSHQVPIYAFGGHEWSIPAIFAGIIDPNQSPHIALKAFLSRPNLSSHEKLEALSQYEKRFGDVS